MHTRARTMTRSFLAGLAVVSLLAACGGDDDDSADQTTTTEGDTGTDEGTDDAATDEGTDDGATDEGATDDIDVCSLIDLDAVNEATGEDFTNLDDSGEAACTVTNDADTAALNLQIHVIEDDEPAGVFLGGAESACDEGTARDDVDLSFADGGGFACFADGEAAIGAEHEGAVALLVGHPSSEVPEAQLFAVLAGILESLVQA